jgi:hypothetical protein
LVDFADVDFGFNSGDLAIDFVCGHATSNTEKHAGNGQSGNPARQWRPPQPPLTERPLFESGDNFVPRYGNSKFGDSESYTQEPRFSHLK